MEAASSTACKTEELVAALLDDFSPLAIEDLNPTPVPDVPLWEPGSSYVDEPAIDSFGWRVFFSTSTARDDAAKALREAHPELTQSIEEIADEDWAARSQRQLRAIKAGMFLVAPPWDAPRQTDAGTVVILIEPSRGFGTGHHASTRLCLRAMSDVSFDGLRVLDLGTGSGVLAIAAALRGAAHVRAVDVDADAVDAARQSQALNPGARSIEWIVGDFRDPQVPLQYRSWDVVVANLTGAMLQKSAPRLGELVAPGGLLITSGFDEAERAAVVDALQLTERSTLSEDGWIGIVFRKP